VIGFLAATGFWNAGIFQDLSNPLLWTGTLTFAAPLILAATGGVISERSGVVNIAMEGMMLVGAFFSFFGVDHMVRNFHLPMGEAVFFGVLIAMGCGCLIAAVHGWVCVKFQANQVVVGMAINSFALGLTGYLFFTLYQNPPGNLPGVPLVHFPAFSLFGQHFGSLSGWSFLALGQILFNQSPIVYAAFAAVILAHFMLFRTKLGLRLRAVGEHPRAADTAGIHVQRLRFFAVVTSGALSGLGGAFFALNQSPALFNDNMTQGRGFIALAAMIVGKWTPFGALGACLLFGFGLSMEDIIQDQAIGNFYITSWLADMLPFIITIIAVTGVVGRSIPPAADGIPYDPTEAA